MTVRDPDRAMRFYRNVPRLPLAALVAALVPERRMDFFWIGAPGKAMLGL